MKTLIFIKPHALAFAGQLFVKITGLRTMDFTDSLFAVEINEKEVIIRRK